MSANLYWEPYKKRPKSLPDALRFKLRDGYGVSNEAIMNASDLAYLQGLRDCSIDGAQELIDAIEKHEAVRVWLEY